MLRLGKEKVETLGKFLRKQDGKTSQSRTGIQNLQVQRQISFHK